MKLSCRNDRKAPRPRINRTSKAPKPRIYRTPDGYWWLKLGGHKYAALSFRHAVEMCALYYRRVNG